MTTPSERLLTHFAPHMAAAGYLYRKTGHRFRRSTPMGSYEFTLDFDGRGGLVQVSSAFFVHHEALEKEFAKCVGYAVPWCAGGSMLNAGAPHWKFPLFDKRFASMTPRELGGIQSEVAHPQHMIELASQSLLKCHSEYAIPFFRQIADDRSLFDFLLECLRKGGLARMRPHPESTCYLAILLAGRLKLDPAEVLALAKAVGAKLGTEFEHNVAAVCTHVTGVPPVG